MHTALPTAAAALFAAGLALSEPAAPLAAPAPTAPPVVRHLTETVDGLEIFFREAGDPSAPQLVLLHGFPTSSHMFRDALPELARDFRVIAPDFPGFGLSSAPSADVFDYTFDSLAGVVGELLERRGYDDYVLYLMDYGAPVGFRLFEAHPERVSGFVVQNGNAYEEGLREFWDPIKAYWRTGARPERDALRAFLTLDATKWQFQHGTRDPSAISPDNWLVVQPLLDRPGNQEVQLDLFHDYRTNVPRYPRWQELFREHQPKTLIMWGRHDEIFPAEGAVPYLRDLPHAELHLLDTGHFALEEDGAWMVEQIRRVFAH